MRRGPPLLFLIVRFIIYLHLTSAQVADLDKVDFTTLDGFEDLKVCIQFQLGLMADDTECDTNGCLCRRGSLDSALQTIQRRTSLWCQSADDGDLAKIFVLDYCKSKGYASGDASVAPPSSIGGYTVVYPDKLPLLSSRAAVALFMDPRIRPERCA